MKKMTYKTIQICLSMYSMQKLTSYVIYQVYLGSGGI